MVYEKFLRAGVGAVGETEEVEGASVGRGSVARRAELDCADASVGVASVSGGCFWSGVVSVGRSGDASGAAVVVWCGC